MICEHCGGIGTMSARIAALETSRLQSASGFAKLLVYREPGFDKRMGHLRAFWYALTWDARYGANS